MSAWIVSKVHIDRIVETAVEWLSLSPDQAVALGRNLWTENLKSVAYRYMHDVSGNRPGPSGLTDEEVENYRPDEARPLSPNEMLAAIHCLDYQSCEHPGWKTSAAFALLSKLTVEAARRGARIGSSEYQKAPWGFDE